MAETKYSATRRCACGNPLKVFVSSGRTANTCSEACARKTYPDYHSKPQRPNHPCADCGKPVWSASVRCKPCHAAAREITDAVCKGCGKTFKPKHGGHNKGLYCSRECAWSHMVGPLHPQFKADKPAPFSRVYFNTCKQCGKEWTAKRKSALCSRACSLAFNCMVALARNVAKVGDKPTRSCECCGASFKSGYGDKKRRFCSDECGLRFARRVGKAKRRAIEYGVDAENIDPLGVFAAAQWVCQSCGIETPRAHRGTCLPDAPELDHVLPLSAGGTHTYGNVQLLCRKCNQEKSDTIPEGYERCFSDDDSNEIPEAELIEARRCNHARHAAMRIVQSNQ